MEEDARSQTIGARMIPARDLGLSRPAPVVDLDWPAEDAASLGHGAVDVWEEFLERLPADGRDAAAEDVEALVDLAVSIGDGLSTE